jgi:Putative auto-transporter adhesin, head GIN domain
MGNRESTGETTTKRGHAGRRRLSHPMALLLLLILMVAACTTGSGDLVTETRDVGEFDRMDVSGGLEVDLSIEAGSPSQVTVHFDDNLQDKIRTEVVDGTLIIEADGSFTVTGSGRMVEVDVPLLSALAASGGSIVRGVGSVDQFAVQANGGSRVDLSDLVVQGMTVDISAGANVDVTAESSIEGEVSGGASLTVSGDPATRNLDVSGGGSVSG